MTSLRENSVIIAEAEPVTQLGLLHLINKEPALRVCGQASGLSEARKLCERLQPALLVVDVALGDGLGFVKDLPQWCPATRVVVFTAVAEVVLVQRAFQAGAWGYVLRRDPVSALVTALHGALAGVRHVSPQVEDLMLGNLARGSLQVKVEGRGSLSNREAEVLRCLGRGMETRKISEELSVSIKTVETHCQRMKEKLGLVSISALRQYAALSVAAELSR